jgi:hypothetical protein
MGMIIIRRSRRFSCSIEREPDRLGNVETDCGNRSHDWLLRIVGAITAPPVRTAAKAVKTSIKFGAQGICVLGSGAMLERLNAELAEERKKAMRP